MRDFLPISKEDLKKRNWDELDIILITGDAYVDHPSYGVAVIGRVLEKKGYRVGIISQPNWRSLKDFLELGKPRLFFGITSGNIDSMVANYTANKRNRKTDSYSPQGKIGLRPDRAVIVYSNRIREIFKKDVIIVIGGLEASLRRFAHYDYWSDEVRRSIILDARADILVYGMGENQVLEIAERLNKNREANLDSIRGTVVLKKDLNFLSDYAMLPSYEEVKLDKNKFNEAFRLIYKNMNPYNSKTLVQKHNNLFVVQFPPALPLNSEELDKIYELPYMYNWHPKYNSLGGIKGFETVRFSITSHRGCCGECSFCSLYIHQGRIVQSRSISSILREAYIISKREDFKGTITDIGGPTANLYMARCKNWRNGNLCNERSCLFPKKCKNLELGYKESLILFRKLRKIKRIRHIFISSGFRFDLLAEDFANEYLKEICKFHISGQMKIAPEHIASNVLRIMRKPSFIFYKKFLDKFDKINRKLKKRIYLVNYFLNSHPGSGLKEALKLGLYLVSKKICPQQVQDFIPLPMTLATCIYYTNRDPLSGKFIYVPKTFRERKIQRAFMQYKNPKNKKWILFALKKLNCLFLYKKFFPYTK